MKEQGNRRPKLVVTHLLKDLEVEFCDANIKSTYRLCPINDKATRPRSIRVQFVTISFKYEMVPTKDGLAFQSHHSYLSNMYTVKVIYCDESVSRGRETGTKGRETGTKGRRTGTIGTKERGNEKPYGLVQIDYWDRGTSPRHVWTWRGRVTPFLDV